MPKHAKDLTSEKKKIKEKIYKQDRQCTCNITLRRVYETIVAVEKQ
jgi:hypothetical protein